MIEQSVVDVGFFLFMIVMCFVVSGAAWKKWGFKSAVITFLVLVVFVLVGEYIHFS